MSGIPLGATADDTGEFFLGRVAVIPVFFDSTGAIDPSTEDWTPEEIQVALDKIRTGVNWWSATLDALGTVHELEFVIDETFARNPVPSAYEPISRRSESYPTYLSPFLRDQGYGDADSIEDAVRQFNHAARLRLDTDWAFTIFMIDSSADADGQFAPGSEFNNAFAFAGGLYVISPSTRPASTITHETGHIFWGRDEYPGGASSLDRRGYYNAQNLNAVDDQPPGFVQQPSIMSAGGSLNASFLSHQLPESTRALIGWRDSDGDGIFDLADVPLSLEGSGRYDNALGQFQFSGRAQAVALPNQNSSGTQNDITLNRVSRIEYRVNGGEWLTASDVDAQVADVQFTLDIEAFDTIELRAIDAKVGVTSPILVTHGSAPIIAGAGIGGFAFVDAAGEGENDPGDALLGLVTATVTKPNGSPVFSGQVEPDDYRDTVLATTISGATIRSVGPTVDGRIASYATAASSTNATFHYYNLQTAQFQDQWNSIRQLEVTFAETVGLVELDAIGRAAGGSFGRLEAYDAQGNLLNRFTTGELAVNESMTMRVQNSQGRIASIRAFGHQFSEVGLDQLRFGTQPTAVTQSDGTFRFAGLADGDYRVTLKAQRLIHQYAGPVLAITVGGGVSSPIAAAFTRVASPWRNPVDPYDVDGRGAVRPSDALRIINEIGRNGTRIFADASQITQFFDVSGDGAISLRDALSVLNEIGRRARRVSGGPGVEGEVDVTDRVFASWDSDEQKNKSEPFYSDQTGEPIVW